ncbi:MAG: DUF1700 domain-containing protein [Ruminococcus sp.]|nr:DUF1700 domain-containing protein [Ruminococcus sp.]
MKRQEFLDALRARLNRLPAEELESALDYYNELFLDAGEENEEQTAEKLGSIDDIARQIYVENGIEPDGKPTFLMEEYVDPNSEDYQPEKPYEAPRTSSGGISAGKLLALILLFPIWFPLLVVLFVLVFVFTVLGIVLEIVMIAVGATLIVSGIINVFRIPPLGVTAFGVGLILVGLFGLTTTKVFKGCFKALVGFFNGFVTLMHNFLIGGEVIG